jgi:hypothetical protein|tara:strand:+ start:85 stop:342 length:258 start_codon:yes stop_codon:yes gene_type:complete
MSKKLTKKELETIQGLVNEFNQTKIKLGDTVISQAALLKKVEELKVTYAEQEQGLIKKYGGDAVINIETGEVSEKSGEEEPLKKV